MATNVWKLTSEGRAALMDGNNRQTRAIVMRTIAIGDGSGAPSQTETESRTTLRSQRDSGVVGGQTNVAGRIAVRASITPSAAYDVTEVGVFGQIEAETPFLLAYWTDSGRVLVPATQDATTVIAGTLDLASAAAEVMVTVSPLVNLSAIGAFVDLSDTPAAFVAGNYLRANSPAADALESVTPTQVLLDVLAAAAGGALPTPADDTKYGVEITSGGDVSLVELPFDDLLAALSGVHLVTAPGVTTFMWPWAEATKARVVAVGADGGDGGGGGGAASRQRTGSGIGASGSDGEDGSAGGATTVTKDAQSVASPGGDGGDAGHGGRGLVIGSSTVLYTPGAVHRGNGGAGGLGGVNLDGDRSGPGGRGGDGRPAVAVAGELTGLAEGDEIDITVGAPGPGGDGGDGAVVTPGSGFNGSDGSAGAAGAAAGWALILPRR